MIEFHLISTFDLDREDSFEGQELIMNQSS